MDIKKTRVQLLLDPRYLAYLKAHARKINLPLQDLMRLAITAFVPNPFDPREALKQEAQRRYLDKISSPRKSS